MAQQFKVFAAKSDDLSSIPGTQHGGREEPALTVVILISTRTHRCVCACTHTLNKGNFLKGMHYLLCKRTPKGSGDMQ